MKIPTNKTKATTIALFLMLTIAVTLVALPAAQGTKVTFAFIDAFPNPIGVNQQTLLRVGIPDGLKATADGWTGLTVAVTRPDGNTETLGPIRTDATGETSYVYVPTMVGNYTLQTHFPAQWYNTTYFDFMSGRMISFSEFYQASDSDKLTLIVQQEPREYYPGVPLPTEYWTRPINAQFREWSSISANWLNGPPNQYAPYNDYAPETGHILWTKPLATGGLAGGAIGPNAMETGDAYEQLFPVGFGSSPVIIGGVLYYNQFKSAGAPEVEQEVVAVDMHTGKELWRRNWNNTRLSFGQVFDWESYNYAGAFAYLWSTSGGFGPPGGVSPPQTWDAYEPFTGRWVYRMTNVPSGTNIYGPKGEIYRYTVDLQNGWVTLWNSSRVGSNEGSWGSAVIGKTLDATKGIEWNKTIPNGLPGSVWATFYGDRIVGSNLGGGQGGLAPTNVVVWGVSLKPGQEGTLLFNTTWKAPDFWVNGNITITVDASSQADGVLSIWLKETRQHYGISTDTGKLLWGPTAPQPYMDQFLFIDIDTWFAYGKMFTTGWSGIVFCYDAKNGSLLWTYAAADPYTEAYMDGGNWPLHTVFITDGKIYIVHKEHSPNNPRPRGAPFFCLDVETGKLVYSIDLYGSAFGGAIIGDSLIAMYNAYDQQIYAIGKGPSATTVTAPDIGVTAGNSVVIRGTVTDISPGTEEYALTARFPNGVPAVSDECMSAWMDYVYTQKPRPSNATGVGVTLDAVDPNGNWIHIDDVTSDASSTFSYMWKTPDIPGKYTVIATFAGSKSYYASYAETAMGVEEAPVASPTPTPAAPLPPFDLYIAIATVVIVIAIVLVGVWIKKK